MESRKLANEQPGTSHDDLWDAGDLSCGELVIHLRNRLRKMPGKVLKVIATDYDHMEEVVFTHGNVHQVVGASIAIPGVISGSRINGCIHVDGGVKNPVPFNHVTEGMDLVVAIDVTGKPKTLSRLHPSNLELAVGSLLIMFNELAELRRAQSPPDIYISPEVDQFGAGDFFKVKEIFAASERSKDKLKRSLELRVKSLA